MNAKKDLHDKYGIIAYDLYVSENMSVEQIAKRTGVSVRTIYRWKENDKWDVDKEDLGKGLVALEVSLNRATLAFKKELDSGDHVRVTEAIDSLDKVTKIQDRIKGSVNRLPIALDLIDDLVNFARTNSPRELAEPIIDLFTRWADDVRRRYKEASK